MKNAALLLDEARHYYARIAGGARPVGFRPDFLHVVDPCELRQLQECLARGTIPADFELKLENLAGSGLSHSYIQQNCRLFIALLISAAEGSFKPLSPSQWDRLLRVLAYVRKDEDAIPDYRKDGYVDDQQEVRAAAAELSQLLLSFKNWRLRQQVPRLWSTQWHAAR